MLGYGFVPVTRAWGASAVLVKVKMADSSDDNPPYAYGYHHPYYGHLYARNTAGLAYPTWPQSLTAWSTGNQSPPFFDPVDLTVKASVSDEEGPTAATAGDCKSSSRKRKGDGMPLTSASAGECRSSSKEDPIYSYLVKIIPPNNKKRATVHEMYDVERRFESPDALKARIIDSFGDKVVQTMDSFQIGYFEGRGSAKYWISSDRDLNKMYSLFESGSRITLWCDGSDEKENQPPTKKTRTEGSEKPEKTEKSGCKRNAAEEELKEIVDQLKANNPTLTLPQIRLWGEMIQAGQYDNFETPPDIQLIRGCSVPAKPKKESVVELIAGAATAVVKAIQQGNASSENLSPSVGELSITYIVNIKFLVLKYFVGLLN